MSSTLKRRRLLLLLLLTGLNGSSGRGYDEHYPTVARQEFLPVEIQHGQCNKTVAIYEDVSTPGVTAETYNKPLTCWYEFRPTGAPSSDYVIDIRFKTFNVGRVHNSTTCNGGYVQVRITQPSPAGRIVSTGFNNTTCQGGYVQIIDGNSETPVTNHLSPGFFCGEMQNSKNFISETNSVKLIFHADNFTEGTYLSFFSRTELTRALHKRYGKQPELYPGGRRGDPVGPNNYCERVFSRCRADSCFVQSPAYPGPYPRNLHCRYHLNVERAYIRLYTADQQVSIDGQRCDSPMICPLRPLTSDAARCTRDFITIYDGKNEIDPKIGTFCGFGRFPYSITGSGTDLLVTFTSSPAGPLLNEGFQFTVGSVPGKRDTQGKLEGLCDWVFGARRLRRSGHNSGQFSSLAHWYPANTTCRHLIKADTGQRVRLRFTSFRVDPITAPLVAADGDCAESLAVYDAAKPRPDRLLHLFCDTFSAPAKSEPITSSGRALLVLFTSRTGSFEASSLFYRASFDFFHEAWWGVPVADTRCDEEFPSWRAESGPFGGPQNRLVFEGDADVHCRYTFTADPRRYARLLINVTALNLRERCQSPADSEACFKSSSNIITSPAEAALCLCRPGQAPRALLTSAPAVTLQLSVSAAAGKHVLRNNTAPLMVGTFQFVHGPFCGRPEATGDQLQYPALDYQPGEPTYCVWQVDVGAGHDLWFQIRQLRLKPDCTADSLRLYTGQFRLLETLCAGAEGDSHSIASGRISDGRVWFHFRSSSPAARLLLQWSRVPSAGAGPAASQLVAVETATSSCTTTPASVSATVRGVVSRWREIGMLGGAVMTLCCMAAVGVWWCRRSRCCPPPAPEERCLTSEVETAPEEQYGAN